MAESLIEILPKIVTGGRREAERILGVFAYPPKKHISEIYSWSDHVFSPVTI